MLSLRRGTVTAVVDRLDGLARVEVDGTPCVVYPRLTGPVALGDEVIVNVQARELALGSGGFDVLHVNLTRGLDLAREPGAHVMKLPYTSLQHAVRHAEEDGPLAESLRGVPVVCCTLHSQLAPVCAGVGAELRVAYVQVEGAALPVSLSDTVRTLKQRGLVDTAIAAGPSVDGDVQCVGVASALAWAVAAGHDVVVCSVGPGIVGTGTRLGHGALGAAQAANAASALDGAPILVARVSAGDPRERHHGVSHHTEAALDFCLGRVAVAWPQGLERPAWLEPVDEVEVDGWRDACADLPLEYMGRGADEEPWFFAAAYAAGALARRLALR